MYPHSLRRKIADPKVRDSVRPAAVWQEIVSYIKGSAEAMESSKVWIIWVPEWRCGFGSAGC